MLKKLKDQEWVNLHGTIQVMKLNQVLSGLLIRFFGVVLDRTKSLTTQFDSEFFEELKKGGNPLPNTKEWLEVNVALSDVFRQSESEFDIPTFNAEMFDGVNFGPGQYEIIEKLWL